MSGRVYVRKFDWDEASRLYRAGVALTEIARRMGVSPAAVRRVVVPGAKARMDCYRSLYQRVHGNSHAYLGECVDCGGRCRTCSTRCRSCWQQHVTQPTVDADGRVFCTSCRQWLVGDAFGFDKTKAQRGFRRLNCRGCETAARAANRAANLERERAYDRERKRRLRAAA